MPHIATNTNTHKHSHSLSLQSQYYTVNEAHILGWVADGYYARSLTAASVEGETGYPAVLGSTPLTIDTDESLIAGFSSRGFATFSLDHLTQVSR